MAEKYRRPVLAALCALAWGVLWAFPWQAAVTGIPLVRLGLALALFILPGACLYGLLAEKPSSLSYLTVGFTLSNLFIALLGLAGRILHLPFALVKHGVLLAGLILLVLAIYKGYRSKPILDFRAADWLPALILMLALALAVLMTIRRSFSTDDLSYTAYLTNWQSATRLGFEEPIYKLGAVDPVRFWLTLFPMSLAWLAEMSGLPGVLLLAGYLEPFLAVLAVLAVYELGRFLGLSSRLAALAGLAQVVCLSLLSGNELGPGTAFFENLSSDKAVGAFILAPVYIQAALAYLRHARAKNLPLFLFGGLSLALAHPVSLAFASAILALLILLDFYLHRQKRTALTASLVIAFTLTPEAYLRFFEHASKVHHIFSLEAARLNPGGDAAILALPGQSLFYGFHPSALAFLTITPVQADWLAFIMTWGWLVIPTLAFYFALRNLSHSELGRYTACAFLVVLFAALPFTGWLVGNLVSPRLLFRVTWFYPFGLALVFLLAKIWNHLRNNGRVRWHDQLTKPTLKNSVLLSATLACLGLGWLSMQQQKLPDWQGYQRLLTRDGQLAQAGEYLDTVIPDQALVTGTDELNDLLPGLSSRVCALVFRYEAQTLSSSSYFIPSAELTARNLDRQAIFDRQTPQAERIHLLQKYGIRFLLLTRSEANTTLVRKLIREPAAPEMASFRIAFETADFVLVEFVWDGLGCGCGTRR